MAGLWVVVRADDLAAWKAAQKDEKWADDLDVPTVAQLEIS